MRLMRFPGDPAMPGIILAQSLFALGAVLGANEVADMASRAGETVGFPLEEGVGMAFISGDWIDGEEVSDADPLA